MSNFSPRIVVISSYSGRHRFLCATLNQVFPFYQLIRPVWLSRPRSISKKIGHALKNPLPVIPRLMHKHRFKRVADTIDADCMRRLQDENLIEVDNVVDIPAFELNSAHFRRRLENWQPDILIVSGAPILKEQIFSQAKILAVNVHYGIAPRYRGEHTIFFPIPKGDFEHLGVTIHQISPQVDGGRILARGYPALTPGMSEGEIYAEATRLAYSLLCELLDHLRNHPGQTPIGVEQQSDCSQLIRFHDRKWHHDLQSRWRAKTLPSRPARRERYF